MHNYFQNMVFPDIVRELVRLDGEEENADLENLGKKMILITCMIVSPSKINGGSSLTLSSKIEPSHLESACEVMTTEDFSEMFRTICKMDAIPEISLQAIKLIKGEFIDVLITPHPEKVARLGNAGRLLGSWIDGVLEYTILKHEVVVLRLKNKQVLAKIHAVSQLWPKKKEFIEGAYKILLFSKGQRKFANSAIKVLTEEEHKPEGSSLVDHPDSA